MEKQQNIYEVKDVFVKEISNGEFTTDEGEIIEYRNLVESRGIADIKHPLSERILKKMLDDNIDYGSVVNLIYEIKLNKKMKLQLGKILSYEVV